MNRFAAMVVLVVVSGSVAAQQGGNPPLWSLFGISDQPANVDKIMTALRRGASPNETDGNGNSAVHYAAGYNLDVLRAVLSHGGNCAVRNNHGTTPLHVAAAQGAFGTGPGGVRALLDCGAAHGAKDDRGNTPLHVLYAGAREAGSDLPNVSSHDGGRRTDVLEALLAGGADPNDRNKDGDSPMILLIKEQGTVFTHLSQLRMMLSAGADPDTLDGNGTPAVIQAIRSQADESFGPDLVSALLKAGADPNRRDSQGDTPLVHVAKHERDFSSVIKVLNVLVGAGADPCLEDRRGRLPYEIAPEGSDRQSKLRDAGGSRLGVQFTFNQSGSRDTEGMCERDARMADMSPQAAEAALRLNRAQRRKIQERLAAEGFNPGPADGAFGRRTREAIHGWQGSRNGEATGYLTKRQAAYLMGELGEGGGMQSAKCPVKDGEWCWAEVSNKPGCYIWIQSLGEEHDNNITGGQCIDGKVNGQVTVRWAFGAVWEGPYVDGKKNGHWVDREADGSVWEGPYVDGEMNGRWVVRFPSGYPWKAWEGSYVDGVKNGRWVVRNADGSVKEGPYVDGERHGRWVGGGDCDMWEEGEIIYEWTEDGEVRSAC